MERCFSSVGACGIDCGLCPRYYTQGESKCPGCGGLDFNLKHPSCKILTCVTRDHQVSICSECSEFPCEIIASWDKADSFVSHQNCLTNLHFIKNFGYLPYLETQNIRMNLLKQLLSDYDDGRSKSFYCLATTLLSMDSLKTLQSFINDPKEIKSPKALHELINSLATKETIILKLRKS